MAEHKAEGLDNSEMRDILADIARNSTNAAARIAAIKELRALEGAAGSSGANGDDEDAFDELAPRRVQNMRVKGAGA